ncbi:hypothetical protein [Mycolicibacterium fluoranthenivorans]|uniref:hypothetical protein n=1 Tax=Mycolicibacterium fluoranthenivorans TaxID=258505 RepID=UPI0038B2CC68
MDGIRVLLDALPPQMRDPVLFAVPFFLLLLVLEWTAARKLESLTRASEATGDVRRASEATGDVRRASEATGDVRGRA